MWEDGGGDPASYPIPFALLYAKTTSLAEYKSVNDIGTPANVPGSRSRNMDNTTK